jgi:D-serine dehydratase
MNLGELLDAPVQPATKGWPAGIGAMPLDAVGGQGWRLLDEDLMLPAAILKDSALRHNSAWMRGFLERQGALIAPHGKTTMAPQLFARQLEDGAFAITVATVQQLRVCRRFGVPRVLMANQLVGRQAIREVLAELETDPTFEFLSLVDSVRGARLLAREAEALGASRPMHLLLEGGIRGARTGCPTVEDALEVARAVAAEPTLALVGVEGFEGVIPRDSPGASAEAVADFLKFLVDIGRAAAAADLFAPGPVILSAGGSSYFDQVATIFGAADLGRETRVVLRSGCYLSHDSGMYDQAFAALQARGLDPVAAAEPMQPAIELWAYVQSMPEPGRAFATMGKRDVSFDSGLPIAERWFRPGLHRRPEVLGEGYEVTALNDQHAFLQIPKDSDLQVGDMLGFGISHPCTTFDKWQLLYVVDDDYRVIEAVRTFF